MPKEIIHPRHCGIDPNPAPQVTIGWSREASDVQISVAPPERNTPPVTGDSTTTRSIVDVLRDELTDRKWSGETNYAAHLEQMILVHERGWYADLDRDGINRLIRLLRKARDAAYGSDA